MIGHSCLINWFFNASSFVRRGPLKSKSMENGKLMDFYFPPSSPCFFSVLLILLKLFPHVLRTTVMVFWIMIGSWRLPWLGGGSSSVIWNAKGMSLFTASFCEQLLRQTQNLMSCEYYEFSKQARASYNITLLCIFILAIYWDQLWLESWAFISEPLTCVYQDLICSGPFNLIFFALH